jgi:hypothetical protein
MSPRGEFAGSPPNGIPPRSGGPRQRSTKVAAGVAACGIVLAVLGGAFLAGPGRSAPSVTFEQPLPSVFPGGPYFTLLCAFSHRNNDDAIVFPGQPGKSHNHTYIGNRTVDSATTPASLLGGSTTCESDADSSAYWVPTLYSYGEPIYPLANIVYYVRRTYGPISPFPAGLKMVAGSANARSRQPKGIVAWSCGGVGGLPRFAVLPECDADELLQLQVNFPTCWNGKALDSGDHKRHMAYAKKGRCPATHPTAVPASALILLYPPVPKGAQITPGRFGAHADFINGWNQGELSKLVVGLGSAR